MVTRQTKLSGIALALLTLAIGAGVWHSSFDSGQARAEQPKDAKLKELLKTRLAVVRDFSTQVTAAYRAGKVPFDGVQQATRMLLDAELELCETNKDRISVLEKIVALTMQNEKAVEQLYKAGAANSTDLLMAAASRLEAEIALERIQSQTPARPK